MDHERINLREAVWIGDSKARLKEFPQPVQKDIGDALFIVQAGSMSPGAKPFKGVGSGVFEIRSDYRTDTYRAVYAVKIGERVYVLHCLKKNRNAALNLPRKRWILSRDASKWHKK